MAASVRELDPEGGSGEVAARAAAALAETFMASHRKKLPRQQIVLLELARLAAEVETAVALVAKLGAGGGKDTELTGLCARLHAGAAARDVATTGLRMVMSSAAFDEGEIAAYREAIDFDGLLATATGELALMDRLAEVLVERL